MMPRDVFICDAVRTPIGRYAGALSRVRADDLASLPLKALLQRNPKVDPLAVDEIYLGCANQAGEDNRNVARMAALLAGLPSEVPAATVNRLCGSGLDAISCAARAIACAEADLAMAGGVESMSRAPWVIPKSEQPFSRAAEIYDSTIGWRFINPKMAAKYGTESMPETAENLATKYAISRDQQDHFALASQQKVAAALAEGRFQQEIIPVEIPSRRGESILVTQDEHPRPDTTFEQLQRLAAPFRANGSVTAGNSSGVNDGACALLLASEAAVKRYGLRPLSRILGSASAGVEPGLMGIGPVPATRKLLRRLNLSLEAMDLIELNEAFAAQVLAVISEWGISAEDPRLNPNGGAIALGHPLGMSGARLVTTASYQLQRSQGSLALCTLCVGVGQGLAMVIERV